MGEWKDWLRDFQRRVKNTAFDHTREQIQHTMKFSVDNAMAQGMDQDEAILFTLDVMEQKPPQYPRLFELWMSELYPDAFFEEEDDDA